MQSTILRKLKEHLYQRTIMLLCTSTDSVDHTECLEWKQQTLLPSENQAVLNNQDDENTKQNKTIMMKKMTQIKLQRMIMKIFNLNWIHIQRQTTRENDLLALSSI